MQKSQRSWAIRVDGLEPEFNGSYQRAGAKNNMPLYRKNGAAWWNFLVQTWWKFIVIQNHLSVDDFAVQCYTKQYSLV